MKTWYKAVCDEHKEMIDIFVNNPLCTSVYLGDKSVDIQAWLNLHYSCNLRLIHFDEDNEKCWDNNYSDIFFDDFLNKVKQKKK